MSNPFEDPEAEYVVLVNAERQHCIWPAFAGVPAGWAVARPAASRQECLDHIVTAWTDMRPASLTERIRADSDRPKPARDDRARS